MRHSTVLERFFLGVVFLGMAGCNTATFHETTNFFFADPVNLKERNYAAADYMVSQFGAFVRRYDDVIKVVPLVDVDEPALQAPVGQEIPGQVGQRLSEIGYLVDLSAVTPKADALSEDSLKNRQPDFILGGQYDRNRTSVDIHFRFIERQSGRVITTYDYTLPYSADMKKMSDPQARIIQMREQAPPDPQN